MLMAAQLGVEAAFLLLAAVAMPWGAHDESVRLSYRNALRRVWLHTGHVVACVACTLLIGSLVHFLNLKAVGWQHANPMPDLWAVRYPAPPTIPTTDANYKKAMDEYEEALELSAAKYQRASRDYAQWLLNRPWFARRVITGSLLIHTTHWMIAWFLWALLRAIGAPRNVPIVDRPPLCDRCGYNLTTIPLERRCPECGHPVMDSLGPNARAGTIWQRRGTDGVVKAAWRTAWQAIVHPRDLGRSIQLATTDCAHRSFVASHLPLFWLVGAAGFLAFAFGVEGPGVLTDAPEILWIKCPVAGYAGAFGAVLMILVGALIVGLRHAPLARRNLMACSIQLACYLSTYLLAWLLFATTSGALFGFAVRQHYLFDKLGQFIRLPDATIAFLVWSMANVVWLIAYLVLLSRGTAAAYYANR